MSDVHSDPERERAIGHITTCLAVATLHSNMPGFSPFWFNFPRNVDNYIYCLNYF